MLKNETIVESPEDVDGVLELCHVLIKDQSDSGAALAPNGSQANVRDGRRPGPYFLEREEMAEEQGWVARMVHLFRAESLDVQFEVRLVFLKPLSISDCIWHSSCKSRVDTSTWGEKGCASRSLLSLPPLSSYVAGTKPGNMWFVPDLHLIHHELILLVFQEDEWETKVAAILKFVRQVTAILATQVEAPTIALRLSLLSAQIADECGFEDLSYDFYVQAFSVYEESISESRAQLQAITLIIGTLSGAKVFGMDNYDTLITKAALHGARLLKKSHQATAVGLASHLWWQEAPPPAEGEVEVRGKPAVVDKSSSKEDAEGTVKAVCAPWVLCTGLILILVRSILIRTASAFLSAFRSPCALPTRRLRKSSLFSSIVMLSITICITLTGEPQMLVTRLLIPPGLEADVSCLACSQVCE